MENEPAENNIGQPIPEPGGNNIEQPMMQSKKHIKKPLKIILIVLGVILSIPLLLILSITFIVSSSVHNEEQTLYDSVGTMQQRLEEKYGKNEQFEFAGECKGGIDSSPYCLFKSAYTYGKNFIVYLSNKDTYLKVKFESPVTDYFNGVFKDITQIDPRIQNGSQPLIGAKAANDEIPKELVDSTVENFIQNSAVSVILSFKISADSSMTEPNETGKSTPQRFTSSTQQEIENTVLSILQEKQVPKNIERIDFTAKDNNSITGFCMSYTTQPRSYNDCHHY